MDARVPIELEEARRATPMASVIEQYVVLGELVEASGPVTAARLFHGLSIDEECVGRIREALERYGGRSAAFSTSMTDPSSTSRSMIVSEYIRGEHCATAVSASEQPLREPLKVRFGHEVIFARFAIVAVCDRGPSAPQRRVEGDPYGVIRNTLQLRLALG